MKVLNRNVKFNLTIKEIIDAEGLFLCVLLILAGIIILGLSFFIPDGYRCRQITLFVMVPILILLLSVLIINEDISIKRIIKGD